MVEKKQWILSFFIYFVVCGTLFFACGGPRKKQKLEVPLNMPEICQGIDFDLNVEMREICGVKVRSFRSYQNILQYRMLLRPKGGKIIKKGGDYELRLPKMLSIKLPDKMLGRINFSEQHRRQYIKSKWEYYEFFPPGSHQRLKIMRIDIPLDDNGRQSVCYTIIKRPGKVRKVQEGYASSLEILDCSEFDRLKPKD